LLTHIRISDINVPELNSVLFNDYENFKNSMIEQDRETKNKLFNQTILW